MSSRQSKILQDREDTSVKIHRTILKTEYPIKTAGKDYLIVPGNALIIINLVSETYGHRFPDDGAAAARAEGQAA